jgi:phosphoribosylformimino-5-aminoimidazole carboxamide ribotide isomerase
VRLEQGDMARATVFNLDPAAQARPLPRRALNICHVGRSRRRLCRQADELRRRWAKHAESVTSAGALGGGIADL